MSSHILQQLSGPLSNQQVEIIRTAVSDLSVEQTQWLSGYLAGLAAARQGSVASQDAVFEAREEAEEQPQITVLYGSQTGNAHGVADALYAELESGGYRVKLENMADYNPRNLKKEQYVALVVSTQGEGDPPDDALAFHEFLFSRKAPKLPDLKFSVMGLGDSSYEKFCHTAKEFDERLAELGGERAYPRIDADVEYNAEQQQWLSHWQELAEQLQKPVSRPKLSVVGGADVASARWSKFEPFTAEVITSFGITGRGSEKTIQHVEISLEDSGLQYQPGDALGVWPVNNASLVNEVLQLTELNGDSKVELDGTETTLREVLTQQRELTQVSKSLIEKFAPDSEQLQQLLDGERTELIAFMRNTQVVELLRLVSGSWQAQQLVDQLSAITPRLYSIASCTDAVDEEVHLTVGLVSDERDGETRFGAASHFLANIDEGDSVRVFVEHNRHFKLPEDGATPIIMVGPGTGVAPFRSFMQQRDVNGDSGDNWLVFGNPHFHTDFLYQTDWQGWKNSGLLTRIDLAFSRDQSEKVYVQHRLEENAAQLYQWLQNGAHFYVCGDQKNMAKAVDETLHRIVAEQSGQGEEHASDYLKQLKREGRYQRDVY
ncbi:MAG: assimilatory sulfite reductase (NADPH) flavoprotein subunit [Porticoccaceae bacterium]|nr:assimilatory sulfite reductase (NADPH) flavoprotein subunit [Porticoccaceae bacterium]